MLASIACVKRAWRSFGRLSGSQPSAWSWAWSWDPLKFMRRHPPHHLSPAQANYPAGQDPEARLSRQSHHSNAPIKPERHLSPARANHPAGPDPEPRLSRPSHHSNAPIKAESQSILSKIVARSPSLSPASGPRPPRWTRFPGAVIGAFLRPPSVAGQYQRLDRQQQRLDPQQQRVHQSDAVDDMQGDLAAGAGLLRRDFLVVAGVGVDDAAAAGRHPLEAALVERLQKHEDRAGPGDVLRFDQLLAAAELAGGDVVLNRGDDHRDDHPGPGDAGRLRHQPLLHDLSLDLAETCLQYPLASRLRNENPGGPHEWIDDIARAQRELLDPAGNPGANEGLVQIHLRLRQCRFGARLFRRQQRRDAQGRRLLHRGGRIDPGLTLTITCSFSMSRCGTMPG